jgi:hypothetical protein
MGFLSTVIDYTHVSRSAGRTYRVRQLIETAVLAPTHRPDYGSSLLLSVPSCLQHRRSLYLWLVLVIRQMRREGDLVAWSAVEMRSRCQYFVRDVHDSHCRHKLICRHTHHPGPELRIAQTPRAWARTCLLRPERTSTRPPLATLPSRACVGFRRSVSNDRSIVHPPDQKLVGRTLAEMGDQSGDERQARRTSISTITSPLPSWVSSR